MKEHIRISRAHQDALAAATDKQKKLKELGDELGFDETTCDPHPIYPFILIAERKPKKPKNGV